MIADVHGNSAALEAVLRDIDRTGADLLVDLGDRFSGPLDAAGTPYASYAVVERRAGRWFACHEVVPCDASAMVRLAEEAEHAEWASAPATGRVSHG